MDYDEALMLEKKLKLKEVNDFTVKLRGFYCFQCKVLNKLRKNYSKFVWLPGKIINVIQ